MHDPSIQTPGSGIGAMPHARPRRPLLWLAILAIPLLLLAACSGGGGSSSTSGATGSNWDQMNWDQGHWG